MNTNKNSRVVNGFMIDKHVPLPSRHHSARYPWADMGDGDSFTMGIKNGKDGKKLVKSIRTCGNAWLKRHQDTHGGLRVLVRKRQDGYDGYRVWLARKEGEDFKAVGRTSQEIFEYQRASGIGTSGDPLGSSLAEED